MQVSGVSPIKISWLAKVVGESGHDILQRRGLRDQPWVRKSLLNGVGYTILGISDILLKVS